MAAAEPTPSKKRRRSHPLRRSSAAADERVPLGDGCSLWQPRKNRFCPLPRVSELYCSHHQLSGENNKRKPIRRLTCRFCGNLHSRTAAAHEKRCTVALEQRELEAKPWYRKNVNLFRPAAESSSPADDQKEEEDAEETKDDEFLFHSREDWEKLVERLKTLAQALGVRESAVFSNTSGSMNLFFFPLSICLELIIALFRVYRAPFHRRRHRIDRTLPRSSAPDQD